MKGLVTRYDRWLGLVILLGAALLFADTFTFKSRPYVPLNTAFWPRVILALLSLAAVILMIKGRITDQPPEPFRAAAGYAFAGSVLYILLLGAGGFWVASALIGALGFYGLSTDRTWKSPLWALAYGVAISTMVFLLFKIVLGVQLPDGRIF